MSDVPLQHIPCKQLLSGVLSERQINQLTFEKWKILSNNSYTLMIFDKALSNTFIHLISRSVSQSVSQQMFFSITSLCQALGSLLEIKQPTRPELSLVPWV